MQGLYLFYIVKNVKYSFTFVNTNLNFIPQISTMEKILIAFLLLLVGCTKTVYVQIDNPTTGIIEFNNNSGVITSEKNNFYKLFPDTPGKISITIDTAGRVPGSVATIYIQTNDIDGNSIYFIGDCNVNQSYNPANNYLGKRIIANVTYVSGNEYYIAMSY